VVGKLEVTFEKSKAFTLNLLMQIFKYRRTNWGVENQAIAKQIGSYERLFSSKE